MSVLEDLEVAHKLFNEIESLYSLNLNGLNECERKENDINHTLELANLTYHERAKLASVLSEVLIERRKYKDALDIIEPIRNLMNETDGVSFKRKLSTVIGVVRKAEASHHNRPYFPRTKLLDDLGINKFKE